MRERIEAALGQEVQELRPLHGGMVAEVGHATLADGTQIVFKFDRTGQQRLDIEGQMLTYLKQHSTLPVPEVIHSAKDLLIMTFLPGSSRFSQKAERDAAEILVSLHSVTQPHYGLKFDTLIGKLHQPNALEESWITFFREKRLLFIAEAAYKAGELQKSTLEMVNRIASLLDNLLFEPRQPSLIHGDIWTTNVLASGDAITGFVDPAIYYGHSEMELAYIAWTGTFSRTFFDHYHNLSPIEDGFFQTRMHIYNLYPTLVHVRHFGGHYEHMLRQTLSRFV
ncbi:MAG: fructosamine kinase family protein [Anaerolineae bacterium]|nr:fructosamine kinase family protein [Anaerolineae bacterium]MCA9887829.1 fructosamine kinase family protein [Anaerolineae bacterium]